MIPFICPTCGRLDIDSLECVACDGNDDAAA